jgi:hypothetical protein
MNTISSRQRMLNAYRGLFSDHYPVAPEFWSYYPAKVLGVDMIQLEREIPLWQALKTTFEKFGTDGWGIVRCDLKRPDAPECREQFVKVQEGQYDLFCEQVFAGRRFHSRQRYDVHEPSWMIEYPVKDFAAEFDAYFRMLVPDEYTLQPDRARQAFQSVGDAYLLECSLGGQFIDFAAGAMGFEKAIVFLAEQPSLLENYQQRYIAHIAALADKLAVALPFESFFMGCAYSCASLIGPNMWRTWDLPLIRAAAQALHRHGKLLHLHYHGRSLDNALDFNNLGVDCVCPFERPPGGDVAGLPGLRMIRQRIGDRVTFNGNVHTVETLIRGKPSDVRREVEEILEAFQGTPRLIIGTGDQVGRETPEENIAAMKETVWRHSN